MTKTVLITGAGGNIGAKVRAHFAALGWTLRLLDVNAKGDPAITPCDLATWDDAWVGTFAEQKKDVLAIAGPRGVIHAHPNQQRRPLLRRDVEHLQTLA